MVLTEWKAKVLVVYGVVDFTATAGGPGEGVMAYTGTPCA